jgi:hypothetical protein
MNKVLSKCIAFMPNLKSTKDEQKTIKARNKSRDNARQA